METRLLAVEASGLSLRTRRGPVYGPVDLAIAPGEIAAVAGPAGSGKTALLLTLAGRMRPTEGVLRVMGVDAHRRPASARSRCGLGVFPGLNDLADPLTVRDTIRAELALAGRQPTRERIAAVMRAVGLGVPADVKVETLSAAERAMLGLALGLVADPAVLLVDDAGVGLTPSEQSAFGSALRTVASRGVAVVVSCVDPRAVPGPDVAVAMSPLAEGEVAHAFA
jgi:ABC-2 type transport system ATP-binding protein